MYLNNKNMPIYLAWTDAVDGAEFVNSLKWLWHVNFLSGGFTPSGLLCQPCTCLSLTELSSVTEILNIIHFFLILRKKNKAKISIDIFI